MNKPTHLPEHSQSLPFSRKLVINTSLTKSSLEYHDANRMLLRPQQTLYSRMMHLLSKPFARKQTTYERIVSTLTNIPFRRRQTLWMRMISFLSDAWRSPYAGFACVILGLLCLMLFIPKLRSILTRSRPFWRLRRSLGHRPVPHFTPQLRDSVARKDGALRAKAPAAKNKVSAWWKSI